ncbi:fimbria/pilus periplasmic chaperone [Pseudomonas sp. CAN2814]|uniref:fimbrial biogenesis chaperone n=1 Tax=Pseudomonas sp. CAN1 TaxID=3046726 RepID=UPI002647FA67|nr:fimbria/pilus periplasmic chaperone [Pseudomonas sp. CAN1]MDN6859325.1 fimbria/pilus periplasmic chaperone [Pseudomonas sp. CAN1]
MLAVPTPRLHKLFAVLLGAFALSTAASAVQAGVLIDGTRIVYPAKEREVTVKLTNKGDAPVLMQIWVDRGDAQSKPQDADAPFLATPPIFRLDPQKGQSVRLAFTGETLPQDRESLFWFNALEIPPLPQNADGNLMQIAVRSRLKLFYRPSGLPGDLPTAIGQVKWKVERQGAGYVLRGENPSPYHLSFSSLAVEHGARSTDTGGGMIAPFAQRDFPLPGYSGGSDGQVRFRWMSDFGAAPEQTVNLR